MGIFSLFVPAARGRNALGRGWLGVIDLSRNNIGSFRRRPRVLGGPGLNGAEEGLDRGAMTQSAITTARAAARVCYCGLLTILVSGCGLSSITSGLGSSVFGGSPSQTADAPGVSEEQLLSAAKADQGTTSTAAVGEISAGCPRINISPRDNHLTIYEDGRAGDGLAIMHRGEITKTARECQIEPGRVTVRYGFSGRVLLGPRGKAGNVTLPVNVLVTDAKREKVSSDSMKVDVVIALDNPIAYFSAVRSVTFNIPEGSRAGEFEVFVGFDQNAPGAG